MKSFDEILETIHHAKENSEALQDLTSDSKTSVWGNFIWIIAYAINLLREMFVQHKVEMHELIASKKLHNGIWIRNKLLSFQYGFSLIPETDVWDNEEKTDEEIETSQIIKYAAVTESQDERRVICKIATEAGGELSPLGSGQIEAVSEWLKEIKPAGVPYTVISYSPDKLLLGLRVFRDALLLDNNGVHRITGEEPVKDALKAYLKELPFNGELRIQELANALEIVEGVRIVQVDYLQSSWVSAELGTYGDYQAIDVRKVPESGYFVFENFDEISYHV